MNETAVKIKRPTSIKVICIIGFIGLLFSIPIIFPAVAQQLGSWYPAYAGHFGCDRCCMFGWTMDDEKWAAYAYTILFVVNQIILLATGFWNIIGPSYSRHCHILHPAQCFKNELKKVRLTPIILS